MLLHMNEWSVSTALGESTFVKTQDVESRGENWLETQGADRLLELSVPFL